MMEKYTELFKVARKRIFSFKQRKYSTEYRNSGIPLVMKSIKADKG